MKHVEKEEDTDATKEEAEDKQKLKEENVEPLDNEYATQSTEKVERNDEQIERDARILDFVARKVAGQEAIMAWREISLSQAAQVS